MSANKRFACRRADGQFINGNVYPADDKGNRAHGFVTITDNGDTIAHVVAVGSCTTILLDRADDLVARLNGSEDLDEEVKALRTYGRGRDQLHIQALRNALKAIVEADDAAIGELQAMGLDVPPGACVLTDMARLALTMGESCAR